jgi:hypothetical protein
MKLTFPMIRDIVSFIAGLGLLTYETLVPTEPRVILIGIAAAMIGLPATFFADRRFANPLTPSTPEDNAGEQEQGNNNANQ